MISVLLTLLKIIGIVLLSLLGLFLVLLLIVLFVPVRYRIKGYYKDEFVCHGKITWLLHLVSVSIDYDKEAATAIRIFGIDISSFLNKKEKKSSDNPPPESPDTEKTPITQSDTTNNESVSDNKAISSTAKPSRIEDKQEMNTDSEESRYLFGKIKDFFTRLREKILSIYNKIIEIIHNIKTKKDSLARYIRILQREEVKNSFSLCKNRIIKMVKHILPKNMKIHAHIGMEDPATTGYILGAYSVLPEKKRRQIVLKADFEEVIMEGDFNIKGHIHAYIFLYHIVSIVFNKDCRTFYTLVKKEISNERQ